MELNSNAFLGAFYSPPNNMGEVPFYWWTGDKLDKERIALQLTLLHEKGVAGVQVNYAHDYQGGEKRESFGGHGKSIEGTPKQITDEWTDYLGFAAKKCEELNMSIGVGDYTLAWIGNGYFTDMVASLQGMNACNLSCEAVRLFCGDEFCFEDNVLAAVTYAYTSFDEPVIIYERGKGVLSPVQGFCEAYILKTKTTPLSISPLNPECGKKLVEYYFEEFEKRLPNLKKGTLNYFFQDELMFNTDIRTLWRDNLRSEFNVKFGYDILGFIPHLFFNLSNQTPKIRLDLADVKTQIIEDSYFKPIYDFHASRGLIYGCDQSSRGKEPDEFGDYFRTVRWFTAPGNDTPGRAADLIKVKVNSSIAHLYNRPRVWLEGYHSSGWGTTLESITVPTSDNFLYGANLLNLHGLYYSTNGGFFEWAPPDFHFRMPYWDDEKYWLNKYKRLSALLTTGAHRCDAAVFYPVSSFDYGENAESCINLTFSVSEALFNNGIDFDFIDFQSLSRAKCINGRLLAANEQYRVLIFCNVDCIRYCCIKKIKEFLDCGGTVIFCGITPYASDRAGLNDITLMNDIMDILSHPNSALTANELEAITAVNTKVRRSFLPDATNSSKKVNANRRVVGNDNLYFVRYAEKDSVCRFEAQGQPYLLDCYNQKITRLNGTIQEDGFVFIKMPLDATEDSIFLFTDASVFFDNELNTSGFYVPEVTKRISLDGEWDFTLLPVLDNTYGDFYFPLGGIIGAEARFFDCAVVNSTEEYPVAFEFTDQKYGTELFLKAVRCPNNVRTVAEYLSQNKNILNNFTLDGNEYTTEITAFDARYGIISTYSYETALFEQGHHGLKGKIYDDFMCFTKDSVFAFCVYSKEKCKAYIKISGICPDMLYINGKALAKPYETAELNAGKNNIVAGYIYNREKYSDLRNSGEFKRSGISFSITKEPQKQTHKLSMSSFANPDYLKNCDTNCNNSLVCLHFTSPPAFYELKAELFGELVAAKSNGEAMQITGVENGNIATVYMAKVINTIPGASEVYMYIKPQMGYSYAATAAAPVKLSCGTGKIECGDTSKMGVLKNYSGKLKYIKTVSLERKDIDEKFLLKLNDVGATCTVFINGKQAAVLTYSPFEADITEFVEDGENTIEIIVSNTLCNQYSSTPSAYSNFPEDAKSGLIGPVEIIIYKN